MLIGRGVFTGGGTIGDAPFESAPRVVLATSAGVIYTMENGVNTLTSRTSALTCWFPNVTWDGTHFYISGATNGAGSYKIGIQRSTDGITWTDVSSGGITTTTEVPECSQVYNYGNGTLICFISEEDITANSNLYYTKSTDSGATWTTIQTLAISGTTDQVSFGGGFNSETNVAYSGYKHSENGALVSVTSSIAIEDRYPSATGDGNGGSYGNYWVDYDKVVCSSLSGSEWYVYSYPGDLSAGRTSMDSSQNDIVPYAHNNGTNYDNTAWCGYSWLNVVYIRKSTNGTSFVTDDSWTPANDNDSLFVFKGFADGDTVISFSINGLKNNTSNSQIRVSWNKGTSWTTISVPGTSGTLGGVSGAAGH